MSNDIMLVTGVILAALAIPAIISAWSDNRSPRLAAIVVLIAGGLIVIAAQTWPGGFTFADIPGAFVRVAGEILR